MARLRGRAEWVFLTCVVPRTPSAPRLPLWGQLRRFGVAQLAEGPVALPGHRIGAACQGRGQVLVVAESLDVVPFAGHTLFPRSRQIVWGPICLLVRKWSTLRTLGASAVLGLAITVPGTPVTSGG